MREQENKNPCAPAGKQSAQGLSPAMSSDAAIVSPSSSLVNADQIRAQLAEVRLRMAMLAIRVAHFEQRHRRWNP